MINRDKNEKETIKVCYIVILILGIISLGLGFKLYDSHNEYLDLEIRNKNLTIILDNCTNQLTLDKELK